MASRRDQKDKLRKEREEREAAAKAEQRRRLLLGYGVGGGLVVAALVVVVVLLAGGGGTGTASGDMLPDGGSHPAPRDDVPVQAAARAAGCELESHRATSREHVADLSQEVEYESIPPTSGEHYQVAAEDGAYEESPDPKELVHTLEHGRVIIWFKAGLSADQRAALKSYFDEDSYQLVLVPAPAGMEYQVAATAWNRDPQPNGTGRLMGCPRFNDEMFTALESFKDEHRSRGPEPVP